MYPSGPCKGRGTGRQPAYSPRPTPKARRSPRAAWWLPRFFACAACAVLFTACSSIPKTPARLYNLHTAELIHVKLYYFARGYGRATAVLPDGRSLEGSYAMVPRSGAGPDRASNAVRELRSGVDEAAFAQVYGFNRAADSHPAGYGVLTNRAGTSLKIVFYSVDMVHEYGTGLARDNLGAWYRVHVGDLDGD